MYRVRPHHWVPVPAAALAVLICTVAMPSAEAAATAGPAHRGDSTDCTATVAFHQADFPRVPRIDNPWFPLVPGARSVLSGTVLDEEGQLHPHKVISTVSAVTKVLHGVATLVVFERDYEDGQLQEAELAFVAQDKRGVVWNVGEYPEEYEDGEFAGAPSTWIAGVDGARAGVSMLAKPSPGRRAYLQGLAPSVEFRDCAKVLRLGQRVCVRTGCFRNALVVDEWAPLEPEEGHQLKYYGHGVGVIRAGAVGGANQEVLTLTSRTTLSRAALRAIDKRVLAQDRRGYRVSRDVYRHTPRARLLGD
jgi:hypothetical protein